MIIVKLQGGLGNQMFQYAVGRQLALKNNTDLKLDISHYKEDKKREYELKHFNIAENFATNKEIKSFKKFKKCRKRIIGKLYNALFADESKYILENRFNFIPEVLNAKNNIYLDGFWQTEKYFSPAASIIREEFTPKIPLGDRALRIRREIEQSDQSVSIHVRRADYAAIPSARAYHGLCEKEYYDQAIKILSEKLSRLRLFIFSDDEIWAKENLRYPFSTIYIPREQGKDHEDLHLMSLCRNNITANSSFSWWGAWLNKNQEKIVIAPKHWVATPKLNTNDLIPESWIKIDS